MPHNEDNGTVIDDIRDLLGGDESISPDGESQNYSVNYTAWDESQRNRPRRDYTVDVPDEDPSEILEQIAVSNTDRQRTLCTYSG